MDPDQEADPDQDPAILSGTFKTSSNYFAYYFLKVFYTVCKDKKSYRSHKTVGINVFLTIFA
jgi:hypothetical protein